VLIPTGNAKNSVSARHLFGRDLSDRKRSMTPAKGSSLLVNAHSIKVRPTSQGTSAPPMPVLFLDSHRQKPAETLAVHALVKCSRICRRTDTWQRLRMHSKETGDGGAALMVFSTVANVAKYILFSFYYLYIRVLSKFTQETKSDSIRRKNLFPSVVITVASHANDLRTSQSAQSRRLLGTTKKGTHGYP